MVHFDRSEKIGITQISKSVEDKMRPCVLAQGELSMLVKNDQKRNENSRKGNKY